MKQTSWNGGLKTTKYTQQEIKHKLKIINNIPDKTEDVKETLKYFDKLILNKNTLGALNLGELVKHINRLTQYVEVLSIYKQPCIRLINLYQEMNDIETSTFMGNKVATKIMMRKEILLELIGSIKIDDSKIQNKDYWESYE